MRVRPWFAAVALACVCGGADAQTVLSEADAIATLSADSPRVRAIRSGIELARADVLSASRWPNPRLYIGREAVAGVSETITTVLQPLPVTGQRRFEMQAASALVDATTFRADDAMRRARADVRLAYADLVAAQARERELTAARDRLQELAGILTTREREGDAAGFDRLRAEREVLDLEADRVIAAADRARAQGRLAGFFATAIDPASLVAADRVVPVRDVPPIEALVDQAEKTRGELLALTREIDSARFAGRAADRRRVPEPEVIAGTKTSSFAGGDVGSVLSVQAVLPLFDRGRAEHARAEARESQAAARLEALRLSVRGDIAAWRGAALERRAAADRYRASAVPSAADVERIARVSYESGERGILELLDAYRTSASARVRQAALDVSAREAEIELEFVSGWDMP
ncbi:MAG TPA: TolC family protein [Vicinamibacterales bacterium]|jgi:cobalt-zinc-cadmium efflux system outer membrane protein|nr:TolC family protein [Vicinamibacterales bacterium]